MEISLSWLALLIPLIPSFPDNEGWMISRLAISIFILVYLFVRKKIFLNNGTLFFILSGILCIFTISSFFYENVFESLQRILWYMSILFLFVIEPDRDFLKKLFFSACVLSVLLIIDLFNLPELIGSIIKYGMAVDVSKNIDDSVLWFTNSNFAGTVLLFMGIPGIFLAGRKKIYHLYNLLVFSGILFTGNRASFLVYILCYIIYFSVKERYFRLLTLSVMICGIIFTVLITQNHPGESSLLHRHVFFNVASKMIQENPFSGVGTGLFRLKYIYYYRKVFQPGKADYLPASHYVHNDFLQFIAENGIPGLILCIILFFTMFYIRKKELYVYMFAFISTSFVQHTLFFEGAVFILILCINIFSEHRRLEERHVSYLKIIAFSLTILMSVLFCGTLAFEYSDKYSDMRKGLLLRPGYGFFYFNTALQAEAEDRIEEADLLFRKALEYDPYWGKIYHAYALFTARKLNKPERSLELFEKAFEYSQYSYAFRCAMDGSYFAFRIGDIDRTKDFISKAEFAATEEEQFFLIEKVRKKTDIQD